MAWPEVSAAPDIAQLAEHLTVDFRSDQMVPGSIPGVRIGVFSGEFCFYASLVTLFGQQVFAHAGRAGRAGRVGFVVFLWPRQAPCVNMPRPGIEPGTFRSSV